MMSHKVVSVLRAVLAGCLLAFLLVPNYALAGKPGGGKGGGKPDPQEPTPLSLEYENYFFRVAGEDSCMGEDDQLEWQAIGSLSAGESFTFTPAVPACRNHPAAISVIASWSGNAPVITSTVPDADLASLDAEQAGQTVEAVVTGNRAQLCMFPMYNSDGVFYTITVTNNSGAAIDDIVIHGENRNDWPIHYYARCLNADADRDGWNDSLEHSMSNLLYPNSHKDGEFIGDSLWGSNYLRSEANSGSPDDEIDSFPPDFNDDGIVDADDLVILESWIGSGNGIALEELEPGSGEFGYHENTLPWRRFDLDADGFVGDEDITILQESQGTDGQMQSDNITPTARISSHDNGDQVARGSSIKLKAHVWDNAAISRVDYHVNGRSICSVADPEPGYGYESPLYFCWWQVPKKMGEYNIEVLVEDGSGNQGASIPVSVTAR
jgi:hypothetical protein